MDILASFAKLVPKFKSEFKTQKLVFAPKFKFQKYYHQHFIYKMIMT
jgi:hypothetical protein